MLDIFHKERDKSQSETLCQESTSCTLRSACDIQGGKCKLSKACNNSKLHTKVCNMHDRSYKENFKLSNVAYIRNAVTHKNTNGKTPATRDTCLSCLASLHKVSQAGQHVQLVYKHTIIQSRNVVVKEANARTDNKHIYVY